MVLDAKVESRSRLSEIRGAHGGGPPTHSSVACRQTPPPSPQFLIANARLKFRVSHSKQTPVAISNRERIAIFQLGFSSAQARLTSAFQGVGALAPTYGRKKCWGFSPWGNSLPPCLLASAIPEIPPATEFLIGTFANSKFESTHCKRNTKQNSNRYKTAISNFSVRSRQPLSLPASLHPRPLASAFTPVAATRRPRYNSGSHTEVNQP